MLLVQVAVQERQRAVVSMSHVLKNNKMCNTCVC